MFAREKLYLSPEDLTATRGYAERIKRTDPTGHLEVESSASPARPGIKIDVDVDGPMVLKLEYGRR